MARFHYAALTPAGGQVRGSIKAVNLAAARTQLLDRDVEAIDVQPRKARLRRPRVSSTELMHLSRQLAAFLRAGIPILDALELLAEESTNAALRDVLLAVHEQVRTGQTLAQSVDDHPEVFPLSYRTMLASAELTGELDVVLDQLSIYLEREAEARQQIRSALSYPTIVAVLSVVTVLIITIFVLPRFKVFFASLHQDLPLPTRILIRITDFLEVVWPFLLAGVVVGGISVASALRTDGGRLVRDRAVLSIPVIGQAVRYAVVERFCRILATMLTAGVPMPEAMSVARSGVGNLVYERALGTAAERILEGQGISGPLAATGVFPAAATQMLRVGEATGSLDVQLVAAAHYYERELAVKVKRITTLVEPAVIIAMGLIVGFVAVALVSAMYGVFKGGAL